MMRRLRHWVPLLVLVAVSPGLAAGQMSFEGLDLSDDDEEEKTDKPKGDFGLDLSGDEEKDKDDEEDSGDDFGISIGGPKVKSADSETMSFEGLALEEGPEQKRAMDAAVRLANRDQHEAAAVALQKILSDPAAAGSHQQAEYLLAKSLYKLEMYHSSLDRFNRILSAGEGHKYFKVSMEWLFFISRKTTSESVVLEDIAAYAEYEFPEKYRDEFYYLLAKYHFARARALQEAEQTEEAQKGYAETGRLLQNVSDQTRFYPKARFLEGLTLYQAGQPNEALERFKDVIRITNPRRGQHRNDDLRDLAFMQLARLHYEHKQNRYAGFYYGKIERDSEQWLQSLFESSWSYFRMGDYERSLGNMVTLHSPFFSDEYFPESLILKAVIYYENCRYPEAKAIVDEFERVYNPVQLELAKLSTSEKSPSEYYDLLADAQRKIETGEGADDVIARILKAALTDKEFEAMNASIREVESEMDGIAERKEVFKFSELAKESLVHLKEKRQELIQKAGLMASAKLYAEQQALKDLIGQGLRIRFETTTKEKEFLEKQLAAGGNVDVVQAYGYSVAVSDEELYWPYEGEYWRDELGTYQYTLTKGCKERLAATASKE